MYANPAKSLLLQGNDEALLWLFQDLAPDERVRVAKPLVKAARTLLDSPAGEMSSAWQGPLSVSHHRAADIVLFPTSGKLLRKVPYTRYFAAEYVPQLFPDDLAAIASAWGELFLKNPKNHDRNAVMMGIWRWFDFDDVDLPMTRGLTLFLATGAPSAAALLTYLERSDYALAKRLVPAMFRHQGIKGASMAQFDETTSYPERTVSSFLIPELIRAGVFERETILRWCDEAVSMAERSPYDKRWFLKLKDQLIAGSGR